MNRLVGGLLAGVLLVGVIASPANAANIRVAACSTILDSMHADWVATQNLMRWYGPAYEANPIVRSVGPDFYFGVLSLVSGATCRETPAWRWVAVGIWVVQTWAVNTHAPYGTAVRPPLITVRW